MSMFNKSMVTRTTRILLAAAMPAAFLAVTQAAQASPLAPPATGIANCRIYGGHGTLSPGLTPAGAAGGVKITFTANLTSPAGGPCPNANVVTPAGVKIIGGLVTGNGYYNAPPGLPGSSCANFHGPDTVGKITVDVHWLTVPPSAIAPTIITYTNNPGTVSGAPFDTIKLNAPPGTAVKSGSFAGPPSTHVVDLVTNNLPAPPCGPGPWVNFHISSGFVLV
jgi:hypothetical protein